MLRWEFEPRSWWIFLIIAVKKDIPPTKRFMLFHCVRLPQSPDSFNKDFYISLSQTFHVIIAFKHPNVHTALPPTKFLLLLFQHVCSGHSHRQKSTDRKQANISVEITTGWSCHIGSLFSGNRTEAKTSDLILLKILGWTDIALLIFLLSVNCRLQHRIHE